jgi:hypothetical protein
MFFDTLEQKTHNNERKLKEVCLRIEKLDQDVEQHFKEQGVNPIEVAEFLDKKENFNETEWAEIQEARNILDKELKINLKNIRDPRKAKKAYNDRYVEPHWLYVR